MWREFRACQLYHCTPDQLLEVPAATIDWHLQMDRMVAEMQEDSRD